MTMLLLSVIYLAFISLGLPDGLLGAAWPVMYQQLNVPVSWAGVISFIISCGTIAASLQSDRLTLKYGTGLVTAVSVAMTMLALWGFSVSRSFWLLCLIAVPYGLGAGGVDASINNYVALHYSSRHMSWLHCMWGVGAAAGPYIMGYALSGGFGWPAGYRWVGVIQLVLTAILLISLPLWKKRPGMEAAEGDAARAMPLREVVSIRGAKAIMITFFCYCAMESTAGLWASSYLALHRGLDPETAARFASLFYLGITLGRGFCGFITVKFRDETMIRAGSLVILLGVACMLLPLGDTAALAGLVIVGLGCAPVYPCIIHSTPEHFGEEHSQAMIGVQMASAYTGSCLMPPVFGMLADHISAGLFPWFLLVIILLMIVMHERLLKIVSR
ncbi:MAG: MFS transporter [Clostridia bacterium]|nr:MFS transporter [Clostridia bacterium]